MWSPFVQGDGTALHCGSCFFTFPCIHFSHLTDLIAKAPSCYVAFLCSIIYLTKMHGEFPTWKAFYGTDIVSDSIMASISLKSKKGAKDHSIQQVTGWVRAKDGSLLVNHNEGAAIYLRSWITGETSIYKTRRKRNTGWCNVKGTDWEVADLGSGHCEKFTSWALGPQGLHL